MIPQLDDNTELLAIFDNAPLIMLLVDEDRRVRRANQIALDTAQRDQEGIAGLRGGEALRCIHFADHPDGCGYGHDCQKCIVKNSVLDTFKTGKAHRQVGTLLNLNTEDDVVQLHVLCSTTPISFSDENMVLVCLEDVTDLKHAEESVRKSEEKWISLITNAPDFITIVDQYHMIEFINHPVPGLLKNEVEGKSVYDFIQPEYHKIAHECIDHVLRTKQVCSYVSAAIGPDNTIAWYNNQLGPIIIGDEIVGVSIFGTDITDRKKVDQLKDEFIGMVSHELRNPLTVIIGAINTALSEGDRLTIEESNQLLQDASLEAETLSHLIGNLLELSRSQANRLLIYPEPISVQDVIEHVVEAIKRQSPGHMFRHEFSDDLPPVHADQLRLERILYNLLENASKYSPEASEIWVSAEKRDANIVIRVSDNGDGISPDEQKKLFESFHRIAEHQSAGITGTGLGLSVCKILVEAHGGSIWVESEPEHGSRFSFSLPLR